MLFSTSSVSRIDLFTIVKGPVHQWDLLAYIKGPWHCDKNTAGLVTFWSQGNGKYDYFFFFAHIKKKKIISLNLCAPTSRLFQISNPTPMLGGEDSNHLAVKLGKNSVR